MTDKIFWHNLSWQEVVEKLNSDFEQGLSEEEVRARQKKFGKNLLPEKKPLSSLRLFFEQFRSPLIYILIGAGIVTLFLGKWTDSIVIFIAVAISALFGFWQEKKTSKVLEKLKKVLKTKATVLRGGQKKEILQEELLPGDIIFLKAGDKVPADGRLIEAENLKISEAVLTGEWLPAIKTNKVLPKETSLADRDNMVYLGSLVESGQAKAIVTETGIHTEAGRIAAMVEEVKEEKTPLQKKLTHFSKIIGVLIGAVVIFIFLGGIFRNGDWVEMFETAIAIAVGGIPEALPVVMVVILAIGMEKILKKGGLIRKLSSVETLGSAEIICFDKTKTLTQGRMELAGIESEDESTAAKIAVLISEAFIENPKDHPSEWEIHGSPTDQALLKVGTKKGLLKPELDKTSVEISRLPFDSANKYLLSLRKEGRDHLLYIGGAPERVLERSKNQAGWKEKLDKMTARGLRVIGVGYKRISEGEIPAVHSAKVKNLNELAEGFTFVGLIALKDPLRRDAKEAIEVCRRAGMRPILVTGDHKLTAKAVAGEIGLEVREENILEGRDLDRLSDGEFEKILERIKIYARVEPKHKMRIISGWQAKEKVVAMIGDGVNDAPALKKADIGVGLGSGTEVAKESSDLILLDDSFAIIVKAVEQGRIILDNLRKGITYVMANSFASALIVGVATVFGWPLPILAVQILWNNIVEDSLPNIAYAFEPGEKGIMKRKPLPQKVPLLTKEMKTLIFATGIIYQGFGLILFAILWKILNLDLAYARTMVFGVLVVNTAFVIFSYKSLRKNIFQYNPFSNSMLNLAAVIILIFFALSIYLPLFQKLLQTTPIDFGSWLILFGISILSVGLIEITKWFFISRHEIEE
jgi:Ca2+-transporting ATPase